VTVPTGADLRDTLVRSTTFGAWCVVPSALVAEGVAHAGFEWVCIDRQHGLIGYDAMVAMIQAVAIRGTPAFVRVGENSPREIGRTLDAGAAGVIVPMVNTVEDAERAVRAARYPPAGERSWGPTRASFGRQGGGRPADGVLLVMLETAAAFDSAEAIASVEGVEGVFVGPADLAVSLGREPHDVLHPEVVSRCKDLVRVCIRHGLIAGIGCHTVAQAQAWLTSGFRMISIGRDLTMLLDGLVGRLAAIRDLKPEGARLVLVDGE